MIEYIGYFAGALTVVSYAPQAVRAWKTKQVKDLSIGMFVLLVSAAAAWIAYGLISKDVPIIATNLGTLSLNIAILVARVKFK